MLVRAQRAHALRSEGLGAAGDYLRCRSDQSTSLSSRARARAPVLVLTSSLANTFFRCHFAVDKAIWDWRLISELLKPRASSFRMSISRSVNGSSGKAVAILECGPVWIAG